MVNEHKLSLPTAILINLNIMMGTGIFINTVELSKRLGIFGAFMYPLIGLLLLPLIMAIAQLLTLYPSGGFYIFAKEELHEIIGFLSTWSYFIAKLASATLMVHVSLSLLTQIFPYLLSIADILTLDVFILSVFTALNFLNLKTGSHIQFAFLGFKLVPLIFVIGAGIIFFSPSSIALLPVEWEGITSSLPLVLYAVMGFEATCAISNKIINPERNAPRVIIISFALTLTLIFLFQLLFYTNLGSILLNQTSYLGAFPALLHNLFSPHHFIIQKLHVLFYVAIATSALGGCYGILYSNNWNLYILAHNKRIRGHAFLAQLNRQSIPYLCLVVEWLFCIIYLYTTKGNQVILQQIAALGTALTYMISVCALWYAYKKRTISSKLLLIPIFAFFSCLLFIGSCIRNFLNNGLLALLGFIVFILLGFFLYNRRRN